MAPRTALVEISSEIIPVPAIEATTNTTATPEWAIHVANAVITNGIEALNGQKTSSFAWNLAGDYDAVTIDVWMMRACGEDDQDAPRTVQYREMSAAVRRLARRHGMTPAEMQALIWIIYRGSAE